MGERNLCLIIYQLIKSMNINLIQAFWIRMMFEGNNFDKWKQKEPSFVI